MKAKLSLRPRLKCQQIARGAAEKKGKSGGGHAGSGGSKGGGVPVAVAVAALLFYLL